MKRLVTAIFAAAALCAVGHDTPASASGVRWVIGATRDSAHTPGSSAEDGEQVGAGRREDKPARAYIPSEGGHPVHLMGLELEARGLPFQQQEQAVGACATTAIWSALSRVARADGNRAPTPFSVTQAPVRSRPDRPSRSWASIPSPRWSCATV